MKWKHKTKPRPEYGEWRVRKAFCFLPKKDKDNVWHWFECVGITEYIYAVNSSYSWFGDIVEIDWKSSHIIDVELIPNALETLGEKIYKG